MSGRRRPRRARTHLRTLALAAVPTLLALFAVPSAQASAGVACATAHECRPERTTRTAEALCLKDYGCRPLRMPRPVVQALLRIARCEQPGDGWRGVRWDHPGPTYPGGMGVMVANWLQFRPRGSALLQSRAHPADQLTMAWRGYRHYRGVYGVRGGTTFWGCSNDIGWGGVEPGGRVLWY